MTFMPIINVWKLPTITVSLKHNLKKNHCLGWRNEHQLTLKGHTLRKHQKKHHTPALVLLTGELQQKFTGKNRGGII